MKNWILQFPLTAQILNKGFEITQLRITSMHNEIMVIKDYEIFFCFHFHSFLNEIRESVTNRRSIILALN